MFELPVTDVSHVADARRRAVTAVAASGFDEVRTGEVALVATELATNILKHGGGGQLLVRVGRDHVVLLALDRGAGMTDVAGCMSDGYSTAGTAGNGLGAVRRLSHSVHIASWPGLGTAIYALVLRDDAAVSQASPIAAVSVPKSGEQVCGDGWTSHEDGNGRTLCVIDGLGHGTEAAIAANAAIQQFQRSRSEPPSDIVDAIHRAIRHTRGAAVAVARIQWDSATTVFAGLGNIGGALVGPRGEVRRMVSHGGTAGHNARRIKAFEYPSENALLIMHSDGIAHTWSLAAYPGLAQMHPMLTAGVLFRDFSRGQDDATVIVTRTARA